MIRLRRPPEPEGFAAAVAKAQRRVEQAIAAGEKPAFADVWGAFKAVYSEAQRGRCGYCEIAVIAGQAGDVEHFAPKSDVRAFNGTPGEEGVQQPNKASLKGRKPAQLSDVGYWWLAYDWRNYLLSCRTCNSDWKGNLFPVREPPARQAPPCQQTVEDVLLLNPFGRRDPARHLQFNADGSVEPRGNSAIGRETIRTVGLHRAALVQERRWVISQAREAAVRAVEEQNAGKAPTKNSGLEDLHALGAPDAPFPGATRAVIRQVLGFSWDDIDALLRD